MKFLQTGYNTIDSNTIVSSMIFDILLKLQKNWVCTLVSMI